ncbi:MAG: type II CAAX endopeptidase family protein [Candidatus Sericytochromatia bacterium]|nr:type II CAAX endopeptidase family protein [Candidatus Sericytochromatia bacterium]
MKPGPGRLGAAMLLPALVLFPLLAVVLVTTLWPQRPQEALFVPIEALGVGLPALLLAGRGSIHERLRSSGWTRTQGPAIVGASCGMLGLAILMTYGQLLWTKVTGLTMPPGLVDLMTLTGPGPKLAWLTVGAVILPGVCEELAFRGVLQRGLLGLVPGSSHLIALRLLGVAALFAAFHQDLYGLPSYLVLGTWLGWVAWITRSLWPGALAHMANNSMALVQANLLEDSWWTAHALALVPFGVLTFATGAWVLLRSERTRPPAPDRKAPG